jgi:small multidrug resistance pump/quaternary ammonium compound-resistance protein SugE
MYLLWATAAAFTFTLGGVCMKSSAGMTRPVPTVLLYLLFAAGATFQALALRRADLGVAYLFVLGLEAVLAFGLGALFFAEAVSPWKLLGVAAIVAGVVLLHAGEGPSGEPAAAGALRAGAGSAPGAGSGPF